jgi:hypothetical protein
MTKLYAVIVDNSTENQIDYQTFKCVATSEEEAISKMMLSDFEYKHQRVASIHDWDSKQYPQ